MSSAALPILQLSLFPRLAGRSCAMFSRKADAKEELSRGNSLLGHFALGAQGSSRKFGVLAAAQSSEQR